MRRIPETFGILLLLVSLLVLFYPEFSCEINDIFCSRDIQSYIDVSESSDDKEKKEMIDAAQIYNERLVNRIDTAFGTKAEYDNESADYDEILNVTGSGQIGVVKIPKINVELPVFHGSEDSWLDTGAAHMCNTSFPIGGMDTHSCISAHTAYPGKIFFDDLDKLEKGDHFYINVLEHVLSYKVRDISVVKPDDTSLLTIRKGEDLVTLITCTPYAVNTHRLLVTGERDSEDEKKMTLKDTDNSELEKKRIPVYAIVIYFIIIFLIIIVMTRAIAGEIRKKGGR